MAVLCIGLVVRGWTLSVGVVYALEVDRVAVVPTDLSTQRKVQGGRIVHSGRLGGAIVHLIKSGANSVDSALATAALLSRVHCDVLVSLGPAGALSSTAEVGSVLRVREIVAACGGTRPPT